MSVTSYTPGQVLGTKLAVCLDAYEDSLAKTNKTNNNKNKTKSSPSINSVAYAGVIIKNNNKNIKNLTHFPAPQE